MTQQPEQQPPLFTGIVDQKTFKIGDKIYESGDKVELTEAEEEILRWVRDAEEESVEIRQRLVDFLIQTDRETAIEIARSAHRLSWLGNETKSQIFSLVNRLQDRIGGQIPVRLEKDLSSLIVRPLRMDSESLNYTAPRIRAMIGIEPLMPVVDLAKILGKITVDVRLNKDLEFQPILVNVEKAEEASYEMFLEAVTNLLKKRPHLSSIFGFETAPTEAGGLTVWLMLAPAWGGPDPRNAQRAEAIKSFAKEKKPEFIFVLNNPKPESPKLIKYILSFLKDGGDALHHEIYVDLTGSEPEISCSQIRKGFGAPEENLYTHMLQEKS
jgi:hypothetical protein